MSLSLSGKVLALTVTHPVWEPAYPTWGPPGACFARVGPEAVKPSKSLKIHPIALFLALTELALLHPLAVWRDEGPTPSPRGHGADFDRKGPLRS